MHKVLNGMIIDLEIPCMLTEMPAYAMHPALARHADR